MVNNNVYTVKVLGRDLKQSDVVLYNNDLYMVDAYSLVFINLYHQVQRQHTVISDMYYHRVTVGQPSATSPSKSKPTIAAINSDVESFIDIRAY